MLKKFFYPYLEDPNHCAGWKAKIDVERILLSQNFKPIAKNIKTPFIRYISKFIAKFKINKYSIFVAQYPIYNIKHLNIKKFIDKTSNTICFIHDILTLQGCDNNLSKELNQIFSFKVLIVHTDKMKSLFRNYGYKGTIIVLGIFDYLFNNSKDIEIISFRNAITVAANLQFTPYLNRISNLDRKLIFEVYGDNSKFINFNENIIYKGVFLPDSFTNSMLGSYGLIWYGDSLDCCNGKMANYLKYISPHKLSCYIAYGIPVIIWKGSVMSKFVSSNNIGLVIESLCEIKIKTLINNYKKFQSNIIKLRNKLINGNYTINALKLATDSLLTKGDKI